MVSSAQDDGFCNPLGFNEWCQRSCPDVTCQFFEFGGNPHIIRLQIYNLFGLFWALFFVSGLYYPPSIISIEFIELNL